MEIFKRLLRSTVFPTAMLGLADGLVIFEKVAWSPEQVAWVNGSIATWILIAKVIFEIDLHRMSNAMEEADADA